MKAERKELDARRKAQDEPLRVAALESKSRIACWLVPASIVLLTLISFSPALQNGFVQWDDDKNVLENSNYRGLGWAQLWWMFTTLHLGNYRPVTWMTLGFDYILWGMNPFGYHLTSLLLHAASALLFYFLTMRLLSLAQSVPTPPAGIGLRMAAGLAALFFSVHPLRVEAVAWISARNHVLSSLFYLSTILCYLRAAQYANGHSIRLPWLSVAGVVYGLSLLSQPMGITLPFVLLVLDVYPLKRLGGAPGKWYGSTVQRVWWEKVPFLLLGLGAGLIALLAKQEAIYSFEEVGVAARVAQALYGLAFYLWKTVAPLGLSPLYQLPIHLDLRDLLFALSALVVLAVSISLYVARHRWPAGLATWVCYLVILSPVLGVAQNAKIVADRYSYLPCLGLAGLAGAGLLYCWKFRLSGRIALRAFVLSNALSVVVIIGLGFLTWKQVQVWRDTETLWRHALNVGQETTSAHNNLGVSLIERGEREEAISHFRRVIEIDPVNTLGFYNLGNALARKGDFGEAIRNFRQAIKIDPTYASAHYNLGNILAAQGELEEAIKEYRETVRNDPAHIKAHFRLGNVLAARGDIEEAIGHFREAVRLQPESAEAHESFARALVSQGKRDEAVQHYQQALRILKSGRTAQEPR